MEENKTLTALGHILPAFEQTDPTGDLHLRARTYDPETGRFLSADTVQPNAPETQGYNQYAYVANNPTTWTDPTGHEVVPVPTGGGIVLPRLIPFLVANWLPISLILAAALIADCALQSPTGVCNALAAMIITVFTVVACVLEVGGPCWGWVDRSSSQSRDLTRATTRDASIDVAPPMATPPGRNDSCRSSGDWQALWNALRLKGNHGLGRASSAVAEDLVEMWLGPGSTTSRDGKVRISADGLRQYRSAVHKPGIGRAQANFEWRTMPKGRWIGNHHLDIDDVNCS